MTSLQEDRRHHAPLCVLDEVRVADTNFSPKEKTPPTKLGKKIDPTSTRHAVRIYLRLTGGWVVLQPEVDVLLDTKAKASSV